MHRKLMPKTLYIICFTLLALVLYSCQQGEIYYQYKEPLNAEWSKTDTLIFDIDSSVFEVNVPYNISIEVTNNVNYSYQNIWFLVQSNIDNDSTFTHIEKEYLLADEFGKWNGSGFGSLYQTSLSLDRGVVFKEKRNYRIKIEQGMRDEPLIGIEKVGIRVSRQE